MGVISALFFFKNVASFFNKYLFLVHDLPNKLWFFHLCLLFYFYLPWRPSSVGLWYFKICLKNNFTCFKGLLLKTFFFPRKSCLGVLCFEVTFSVFSHLSLLAFCIGIIFINYVLKVQLVLYFYIEEWKKKQVFLLKILSFFKKIMPRTTLFWSYIFCFFSFVSFGGLHLDYIVTINQ